MLKIVVLLIATSYLFATNNCIDCHKKESQQCQNSNHFTLKKAINITRKTWGITNSNTSLQSIPHPPKNNQRPQDLVDDFKKKMFEVVHIGTKLSSSSVYCAIKTIKRQMPKVKKSPWIQCFQMPTQRRFGRPRIYFGTFPKGFQSGPLEDLIFKRGKFPTRKFGLDFPYFGPRISITLKDDYLRRLGPT